MNKKRNRAGATARANMAYYHRDASAAMKLNKALDDFMENKRRELDDSMELLLPLAGSGTRAGRTLGMALGLGSMFGVELMNPMRLAGISTVETGRTRSDERLMSATPKPRYAVPPLFAHRDNGHRQSKTELDKLEELIADSTYDPPMHTRDRFMRPDWGPEVELVDGRHPDAGKWGKLCYRTACQRPHAFFYNSGTYKHYCQSCADSIDRENMAGMKLHHLAAYEGQPAEV